MKAAIQIGLGGILLVLIIFYILFIYLPQKDVNYSIQLQNNKIQKGTNVVLFYTITNGLNEPIYNLTFHYKIEPNIQETTIDIGAIQPNSNSPNSIELQTHDFSSGKYIVWTKITYNLQDGQPKGKELTLQLEIF